MSPEPTGVHGLLKQRKLFTHKFMYNTVTNLIKIGKSENPCKDYTQ